MTQIANVINNEIAIKNERSLAAFFLAVLLIQLTGMSGCVSLARATMFKIVDVSDKAELHGDLRMGEVFVTETYLFLQNDQDIGKEAILVTPGELGVVGGMEYDGPRSRDEYVASPDAWPQVLGILEHGTHLQVSAVYKVNSAFGAGWTYPVVTIIDGENKGRKVNIVDLVKKCNEYGSSQVITHCIDSRLLRRVNGTAAGLQNGNQGRGRCR